MTNRKAELLVIDDDPFFAQRATACCPPEANTAHTVDAALDLIEENSFDLIIILNPAVRHERHAGRKPGGSLKRLPHNCLKVHPKGELRSS
jgi:hypothetical protein